MKNTLKNLGLIALAVLVGPAMALAAVFVVPQGGTGKGTLTASQLVTGNGTSAVYTTATTSVACGGIISCTGFTAIGPSPITITASAGASGLATSSPISAGNVLTYSSASAGSAFGTATTSLTISGPFNIPNAIGVLSNGAVTYWGLATTSSLTQSQLLYNTTGGNGVASVATTSITGGTTGLSFSNNPVVIGASSAVLSGTLITANGGTNHGNFTAGSVVFAGTSGTSLTENNANIFWDNTLVGLGIGTTTPRRVLTIASSSAAQLVLTDGSSTGAPFNFRTNSTHFSISTSSPTTFATTTPDIFQLDSSTGSTTIQKEDVVGTATSTHKGGINLEAGCFSKNNVCVGASSGSTITDYRLENFNVPSSTIQVPVTTGDQLTIWGYSQSACATNFETNGIDIFSQGATTTKAMLTTTTSKGCMAVTDYFYTAVANETIVVEDWSNHQTTATTSLMIMKAH